MKKKEKTTITLKPNTKDKLDAFKLVDSETYDSVVTRMMRELYHKKE